MCRRKNMGDVVIADLVSMSRELVLKCNVYHRTASLILMGTFSCCILSCEASRCLDLLPELNSARKSMGHLEVDS